MMSNKLKAPMTLFLAAAMVLTPLACISGETVNKFTGNQTEMTLVFPRLGGFNNNVSVDLPKHIIVTAASVDITGGNITYDPVNPTIDFNNPGTSTAHEGAVATLPPNQAPASYQTTNKTADQGIKSSDDRLLQSVSKMTRSSHTFAFHVGDNIVNSFNFRWEGYGFSEGDKTGEGVELYFYKGSNTWELVNKSGATTPDWVLWYNLSAGVSDFVDSKGNLYFLVTTIDVVGFYYNDIETDYVSFRYTGTERFYPLNVRCDVGGDGTTEFWYNGTLNSTVKFEADAFVSGLQRVLDAASTDNVSVKLRFLISQGGKLTISNLIVEFDRKDLPPKLSAQLGAFTLDEDANATGLLDLWNYFFDDKGANNLTYTIVYEEDNTKLDAQLAADGHKIDFFTRTANWFGSQKFRVTAEDAAGQWAETNNFTVNVNSVNDLPRLRPVPLLVAHEGIEFTYTFNATDIDLAMVPEEHLTFSAAPSFITLDADTGRMSYTPKNADVGTHYFNATVTDTAGASDSRGVTISVENRNNGPVLADMEDQTVLQDQTLALKFNATDLDLDIGLDSLEFTATGAGSTTKTGQFKYTPSNRDVGEHTVSVTVKDQAGLPDTKNFTITVINVNDPPRITVLDNLTVDEDVPVTFKVNASDIDAGDVLKFKDNTTLFDINSTGGIKFTPAQKDVGVHYINISVSDVEGATASFTWVLTVRNVNDRPRDVRIKSPANNTIFQQGAATGFEGVAVDDDGDALNYSWFSEGANIGYGENLTTKALKPGIHTIELRVSDGTEEVVSAPLTITVKAKPKPTNQPGFEAAGLLIALGAAVLLLRRKDLAQ